MRRVLVTRPAGQAQDLQERLAERGIASTSVPTVAVAAADSEAELAAALGSLEAADGRLPADWLVLTSANGARAVVDCLRRRALSLPQGTRLAGVGPATAAVLRDAGHAVDYVPPRFLTVAIADGLGHVAGRRVVLARADLATDDLARLLLERGAIVEEVVAYRTVEGPAESREPLQRALADELDGITFTSGSTVRGLVRLLQTDEQRRAALLPAFCIGPVTADVARRSGFEPAVIAREHTSSGLARAVADYFGEAPA
jgi:uroporphyrinogen-III synthase